MSSISEQNSQTHFPATRHLETGVTMWAFLNDELFETRFLWSFPLGQHRITLRFLSSGKQKKPVDALIDRCRCGPAINESAMKDRRSLNRRVFGFSAQ
jgi:hypothetical protein